MSSGWGKKKKIPTKKPTGGCLRGRRWGMGETGDGD